MKNQPGTMKNHENPIGIIKNMKNQSGTMKNHENPPGTIKSYKFKLFFCQILCFIQS